MNKQDIAKMQIEAELAATLAKLTTLSQYIDPKTDYKKTLEKLQRFIWEQEAILAVL